MRTSSSTKNPIQVHTGTCGHTWGNLWVITVEGLSVVSITNRYLGQAPHGIDIATVDLTRLRPGQRARDLDNDLLDDQVFLMAFLPRRAPFYRKS